MGHTTQSHFLLTAPAESPASFRTSSVQLRWLLRFEFIAAPVGCDRAKGGGGAQKVEWCLPLEMSSVPPPSARHPRRSRLVPLEAPLVVEPTNDGAAAIGHPGLDEDVRGMVRDSSLLALS